MKTTATAWGAVLLLATTTVASTAAAQAGDEARRAPKTQTQRAQPPGAAGRDVERLFDAYVALQAQDVLKLNDTQSPAFLGKLRALQQVKRRGVIERRQILADLSRQLKVERVDEARLQETLRALKDHDDRLQQNLLRAYEALDQVLDVGQRARFRLFEDQVERRKLELLMRARRRAAAGLGPGVDR